jgi:hypothetical protein
MAEQRLVRFDGSRDLLEIVGARRPPGGLAGRLKGRHEEGDEDPDDRHHDQKFDERDAIPATW